MKKQTESPSKEDLEYEELFNKLSKSLTNSKKNISVDKQLSELIREYEQAGIKIFNDK